MALLVIISLAGCAVLALRIWQNGSFTAKTRQTLAARVNACCTETKNLAEKLTTSIQSNTPMQLANIQQGIYAMDQLNNTAIALYGESGRLVPREALTALYQDMESYFSVIQTSTSSVLEIRTLLINHLAGLQELLMTRV